MAQMRIFLSHSSADKSFCDALVRALREAGASVWYDEEDLGAGTLLNTLQTELQSRPVFIVILSKAALASKWVARECRWAYLLREREPDRIILPVLASPVKESDLKGWLFLEEFKRIEQLDLQPYAENEAITRTLRILALKRKGDTPAPVSSQSGDTAEDIFRYGQALAVQKEWNQATRVLRYTAQIAPRTAETWANLGQALVRSGMYTEALDACNRALALDASSVWVWVIKGRVLRAVGRDNEAFEAYETALGLDSKYASALSDFSGSPPKGVTKDLIPPPPAPISPPAGSNARNAVPQTEPQPTQKTEPPTAPISGHVGKQRVPRDTPPDLTPVNPLVERVAFTSLNAASEQEWAEWQDIVVALSDAKGDTASPPIPGQASEPSRSLPFHMILANYEGADRRIGKHLVLSPQQRAGTWLDNGKTLSVQGLNVQAVAAYCQALLIDPTVVIPPAMKGLVSVARGRYEDALVELTEAIASNAQDAILWAIKGDVLRTLWRLDEALSAVDHALELVPEYAELWINKGNLLYAMGRHTDALAAYNQAANFAPKYAKAWTNKGNVLLKLGYPNEALQAYDHAIELGLSTTSWVACWRRRTEALRRLGRDEEAKQAELRLKGLPPP